MSLAAFTRFLMEKGASPEVIEAVVDYVTRDSVTVTRDMRDNVRELARVRQQRRRGRLAAEAQLAAAKANDVAGAEQIVTRDKRDTAEVCTNVSKKVLSINEARKKKESKEDGVEDTCARGTRISADQLLTDEFRDAAIKLGADPARIPEAWAEFIDYWTGIPGQRGRKSNWLGTWRNRVRDVLSKGNRNGQSRQSGDGNRGKSLAELAIERARAAGVHN